MFKSVSVKSIASHNATKMVLSKFEDPHFVNYVPKNKMLLINSPWNPLCQKSILYLVSFYCVSRIKLIN